MKDAMIETILELRSSKVSNYVIAGLNSYLLENGKIRLFENTREHQDQITPHSHRFDFTCFVLRGHVINKEWIEMRGGDLFQISVIRYKDEIGHHDVTTNEDDRSSFNCFPKAYKAGETYSMNHDQIHSIDFSRDALVLFVEKPSLKDTSLIIEPVVDGELIRTYETKPYMFKRCDNANY